MSFTMCITLFGDYEAKQQAKGILENHPHVRRADVSDGLSRIRLVLSNRISEGDIIEMLCSSGLNGIRIDKE